MSYYESDKMAHAQRGKYLPATLCTDWLRFVKDGIAVLIGFVSKKHVDRVSMPFIGFVSQTIAFGRFFVTQLASFRKTSVDKLAGQLIICRTGRVLNW